jgi:RNA polymerase sigma factor (sigma-70 family)
MTATTLAGLIDRYAGPLRLYARQWCLAPEDAVQDAFCKLMRVIEPDDPAAWLYRAVKNSAIDIGRAESRRRRREEASARPERWFEESWMEGIDAQAAVKALESLDGELREVIVARIWGNLTFDQISRAQECSISSASRRFDSGIAALQKILGEECLTSFRNSHN